jgi:hypothetical protein
MKPPFPSRHFFPFSFLRVRTQTLILLFNFLLLTPLHFLDTQAVDSTFSFQFSLTPPSLDLLAFFITYPDSPRVPTYHAYVQDQLSQFNLSLTYYFVDYSFTNTTNLPNLAVPLYYKSLANLSSYLQNYQSALLAKYFFVFNYITHETNARWIFRGADDTMINFKLLPFYIAKLNAHFDPLKEIVIRGHCMQRAGIAYHQGGAGMLFSRRAIERIAPLGEETLRGQTMWEDAQLGWKLGSLGIDLRRDTWSTAFVGTPFTGVNAKALETGDFREIARCERIRNRKRKYEWLAPARDILFMHEVAIAKFKDRLRHSVNLFNADEDVYWFSPNMMSPGLCREERNGTGGWRKEENLF